MKLPQALANIGGILNVILFSGKFLMYFWSQNSMLEFNISEVITEEERKKSIQFFEDIREKKLNLNSDDISLKNISKLIYNQNIKLNRDNFQRKDMHENLNDNAISKIGKTKIPIVNTDMNLLSTPQTLKYPKRFIEIKKENRSLFINDNNFNNTSNINLKNKQESNHLKEINEIKAICGELISNNNKEIINDQHILSENEVKNIKDADRSLNVFNQARNRYFFLSNSSL